MRPWLQSLVALRPAWLSWLLRCPEPLVRADTQARRALVFVQLPLVLLCTAALLALPLALAEPAPLVRAWLAFAAVLALLWPPSCLRLGVTLWRGVGSTPPELRTRLKLYAAAWLFVGGNGVIILGALLLLLGRATFAA